MQEHLPILDGTLPRRDLWKQRVGGAENTGRAATLAVFHHELFLFREVKKLALGIPRKIEFLLTLFTNTHEIINTL